MIARMSVTVRAAAKINLRLAVGPPREDGFHPLLTVYQAISLYDDVTVSEADAWSVSVEPTGDLDCSGAPLDESNIAVRAGRLLSAHHGVGRAAAIRIAKGIPVAGGLAGGSADAAASLVALDRLWDLNTSDEDLLRLAAELGSDVPFALLGGTARGTGRGEVVDQIDDPGTWWWVVVPDATGMSTPEVYREYDRLYPDLRSHHHLRVHDMAGILRSRDFRLLGRNLENDLQPAALSLRPDLEQTDLDLFEARAYRLLSGSGPTFLGLVETQERAHEVREHLLDRGYRDIRVATGPVAGAHVVEYV
jgi:4-diphosphocytidyl-2-C-methyl-D-erythritol kinase